MHVAGTGGCAPYRSTEVRTEVYHTRFVHTALLNHKNALPAQLSSAIAQQRAGQRGALPCGAAL